MELINAIKAHPLYADPLSSDSQLGQYRDWCNELIKLELKYPELKQPNSPSNAAVPNFNRNTIGLPFPIYTPKEIFDTDALRDWAILDNPFVMTVSEHIEGLPFAAVYNNGELQMAATKPIYSTTGYNLIDIVRTIPDIPNRINIRGRVCIEAVMTVPKYASEEEKAPVNPYAVIIDTIRKNRTDDAAGFNAIAYDIVNDTVTETQESVFDRLYAEGFTVPNHDTAADITDLIELADIYRQDSSFDYTTDGALIQISDRIIQRSIKPNGRYTQSAILFK